MIPLCAPHIRSDEWTRIKDCIDSEWVSYAGKYVTQFEQDLSAKTGSLHASAMISGTAALHVALIIAGVKQDEEVILPALSFVAPANAIRYQGALPVFVDVSMKDWQMDVEQVEFFLKNGCKRISEGCLINQKTGRRVAAIMAVHLLGGMADLDALARIAAEYDLPLIEDAAECLGAHWRGKGIGAPIENEPEIQRYTCTSFNGNKMITTGGGGALLTNRQASAQLAKHLSTTAKTDDVEFEHDQVGYNYRMSNMAAALGVGQLLQLDYFLQRKMEIALRYKKAFAGLQGIADTHPNGIHVKNSYWLYTILLGESSRPLLNSLAEQGIQSRPLWKPLSTLKYLASCHIVADANACDLANRALSIPCSVGLSDIDQVRVIQSIHKHITI